MALMFRKGRPTQALCSFQVAARAENVEHTRHTTSSSYAGLIRRNRATARS